MRVTWKGEKITISFSFYTAFSTWLVERFFSKILVLRTHRQVFGGPTAM